MPHELLVQGNVWQHCLVCIFLISSQIYSILKNSPYIPVHPSTANTLFSTPINLKAPWTEVLFLRSTFHTSFPLLIGLLCPPFSGQPRPLIVDSICPSLLSIIN